MTMRKPVKPRKRFEDTLTDEQRALLRQSSEEAERERPEIVAMLRKFEADMAPVNAEIRNVFRLCVGLRTLQNIPLSKLAEQTGIDEEILAELERDPAAVLRIDMLSNIARALGAELRISLASAPAALPPVRKRKATTASEVR